MRWPGLLLLAPLLIQACSGSPGAEQDAPARPSPTTPSLAATVVLQIEHDDGVFSVAFAPDGRSVATGCRNGGVRVFDVASASSAPTRVFTTPVGNKTSQVAFSPDGTLLFSSAYDHPDAELRVWDVERGDELHRFGDSDGMYGGAGASVDSFALSPSGDRLADSRFRLWTLTPPESRPVVTFSSELSRRFGEGQRFCRRVEYAPHGQTIAFATDEAIELWSPMTGRQVASLEHEGVRAIAYSPDGRTLVSAGEDGRVLFWRAGAGDVGPSFTLEGHGGAVRSVAFRPDGKLLASGGDDGTVKLWDVPSKRPALTIAEDHGSIRSLDFSPDGRWLAAGTYEGKMLLVWNLRA